MMDPKQERKQRFSLTLLFSAIVVVIIVSVLILVGLGLFLCLHLGILSAADGGELHSVPLLLIFAISCTVVGSGMTLIISRFPLKPVNRLLNIMNRVASGDFSARITLPSPWSRHPGLVELSESFNKMAAELEGTEMLRSDFINNFSHEFKTPIVSITGFAKLLSREKLSPRQAEYVRIIEEESLRLSSMATNVLNLTKVENLSILTDKCRYNLSEQLRSCILLLSASWEEKEIDLVLDFQEFSVNGSEELLKHVWLNLIDNAVKFSPRGAQVEIRIADYLDFLEVSVINPGPEIPSEKRDKIFGKFYQADESHATHGNGVGLAIVKKVVELHRGSINVQSESGLNIFSVRLPKK